MSKMNNLLTEQPEKLYSRNLLWTGYVPAICLQGYVIYTDQEAYAHAVLQYLEDNCITTLTGWVQIAGHYIEWEVDA